MSWSPTPHPPTPPALPPPSHPRAAKPASVTRCAVVLASTRTCSAALQRPAWSTQRRVITSTRPLRPPRSARTRHVARTRALVSRCLAEAHTNPHAPPGKMTTQHAGPVGGTTGRGQRPPWGQGGLIAAGSAADGAVEGPIARRCVLGGRRKRRQGGPVHKPLSIYTHSHDQEAANIFHLCFTTPRPQRRSYPRGSRAVTPQTPPSARVHSAPHHDCGSGSATRAAAPPRTLPRRLMVRSAVRTPLPLPQGRAHAAAPEWCRRYSSSGGPAAAARHTQARARGARRASRTAQPLTVAGPTRPQTPSRHPPRAQRPWQTIAPSRPWPYYTRSSRTGSPLCEAAGALPPATYPPPTHVAQAQGVLYACRQPVCAAAKGNGSRGAALHGQSSPHVRGERGRVTERGAHGAHGGGPEQVTSICCSEPASNVQFNRVKQ